MVDRLSRLDEHCAMTKQEALPLRCALGALALLALLTQVALLPRVAGGYAEAYPEVAYLASPYVTALVVAIAGFQVFLLAAWQLLSAAVAGGAPAGSFRRWVNVLPVALGSTAIVLAGVCAHAGSVAGVGGPGMLFGIIASLALIPAAVALRNKALGSRPNPEDHANQSSAHTS